MSLELALGHYMRLLPPSGGAILQVQNYHINETVPYNGSGYSFLPFAFSGLTSNRRGENSESTLVFPNTDLSRPWAIDAAANDFLAEVWVVVLNPDTRAVLSTLTNYIGQVSSAGWDDTAVTLRLNSILDAVGVNVPARSLHANNVGHLPISSNLSFR